MIAATQPDWVGIATVIAACGSAVAAIVAAVKAGGAQNTARASHAEMQTGNGKTLGETVTDIKKTVNGADH